MILASTEVEHHSRLKLGASPEIAGALGGVAGGAAQAYLTMGESKSFESPLGLNFHCRY